MTREERLAAGWSLSGWAVQGKADRVFWAMGPYPTMTAPYVSAYKPDRRLFAIRREALKEAASWQDNWTAKLVAVWRRRKPKAPPPLAVGDVVMVTGRVAELTKSTAGEPMIRMTLSNGNTHWHRMENCERVKP